MHIDTYEKLSISTESWYCRTCTLPNFSDSSFEQETENDYIQPTDESSIIIVDDKNETFDIFKELVDLRKKSPLNIICVYLNINS